MDVAVAQHRHMHGRFYAGDDLRVDAGGVHLLPRPGVYCDEGRTSLFAGLGALDCGDVVGVPAFAHLDRDGPGGVCHYLLDDPAAEVGVQHQFAAGAAGDDLRGRAAHVDVQKVESVFLDGGGCFAHDLGHFAEDLDAVGGTVGFGLEQADRFVVVVDQRPAGHHLTDCETGPVLRHQAAAGRIGEACHGAEHGPVGQGDVLDLQRFHCVPLLLDKTIKNYYTTNRERRWLQNGQLLLGSGVKKNDRLLW